MSFKKKVDSIDDIKAGFKPGKQALGSNSGKIKESSSTSLNGSVDLDASLKTKFPNASRWDYTIGYKQKSYFIEVHPATEGEIITMINKLEWLKGWLRTTGKPLLDICADDPFHWVFTNRNAISKRSSSARKLTKAGLSLPKRELVLK